MAETLQSMGIQWPKLIAQAVNFAIVLFILWKWAYKPVFAVLEARRQKIAEGVADAEKSTAQLAKTEADRKAILAQAGDQANKMIEEARVAALPFYFLELLVAVVQALVFTVLSISFIGILCSHMEEEGAQPDH